LTLPPSTTIDPNTKISVTLDGVVADVSLAAGSYTATELATLVQTSINSTSAFTAVGATAKASVVGGVLALESNKYGSTSAINIASNTGTGVASLTGTVVTGSVGKDVAGTLNGITATGNGQSLTGAAGSPAEGLKLLIAGGSLGARGTVNFSVGYATQLSSLISGFTGSSGTITSTTSGVTASIKEIGKQRITLNSRLFDVEARYRAQFTALDRIVSGLNNTSTFLTQQLAALTGSNK